MNEAGSQGSIGSRPYSFVRFLRSLVGIALFGIVLILGYLWSLRPQTSGMVRLQELPEPVFVARDRIGIPYIAAETEESAFFALGYVHAQDRLWQMELLRRAAWGELTPLFGPSCHGIDIWHRRIGFYRQAMEIRPRLSKDAERVLKAYARGASAYLRAHPFRLPPAFLLSRLKPNLWKIEDVLAIGVMTQWLAVPWSTRIPAELTAGTFCLGNDTLTVESTPEGLSLLLSDLVVRATTDCENLSCSLAWGRTITAPWHEAAIRIGDNATWRGWAIPGWPIPHVSCSLNSIRALVTDGTAGDPWMRDLPNEGWTPVLEFLDGSPTSGLCDTVLVSSGFSSMKGLASGTEQLASNGAPGWHADVVMSMLRMWRDDGYGGEAFFDGSPFTYISIGQTAPVGTVPGERGSLLRQRMHLKPLIEFGILDFFFPSERSATVDAISMGDYPAWSTSPSSVAVRIQWKRGGIYAIVAGGVSEVPGSRWRMNQMKSWEQGKPLYRSPVFPITGDGCILVPADM